MPIQPGDPMSHNLVFVGADEPSVTTYIQSSTTDAFFGLSALSLPDTSSSIGSIYVLKTLERAIAADMHTIGVSMSISCTSHQ